MSKRIEDIKYFIESGKDGKERYLMYSYAQRLGLEVKREMSVQEMQKLFKSHKVKNKEFFFDPGTKSWIRKMPILNINTRQKNLSKAIAEAKFKKGAVDFLLKQAKEYDNAQSKIKPDKKSELEIFKPEQDGKERYILCHYLLERTGKLPPEVPHFTIKRLRDMCTKNLAREETKDPYYDEEGWHFKMPGFAPDLHPTGRGGKAYHSFIDLMTDDGYKPKSFAFFREKAGDYDQMVAEEERYIAEK